MSRIRKDNSAYTPKVKWLLAGLCRLSREDGNDVSKSIKSQKMIIERKIRDLIEAGENVEFVDWFVDDGISGVYDTRESFQKMLLEIEKGNINGFIVTELQRAFRNDGDQKYYLEQYFRQRKTRVISCSQPELDTFHDPNKIYNLEVKFHGMMNAYYPIELSSKIKDRLKARRMNGEFVGSFAPYGYQKSQEDKHVLEVDEEASEIVKLIFNMFVHEGYSQRKIVQHLNALAIPNPAEYKRLKGMKYKNPQAQNNSTLWHTGTIKRILQSEYYIGNLDQHRVETEFGDKKKLFVQVEEDVRQTQIIENTHDAIIDQRTFELAQTLLARDTRIPNNSKTLHLFSGMIKCGDCGRQMVRNRAKNIVYYNCGTYNKVSKNHCTKHSIREDVLEETVLKMIQTQISLSVDMSKVIDKINQSGVINNTSKRIEDLLNSNTKRLREEENVIDNLYIDWKKGNITQAQFMRVQRKTEERLESLKEAIKQLEEEKQALVESINKNNKFLQTFTQYQNIQKLDRSLLVELVNIIYIYEDENGLKTIDVCFNFEDEYKLTLEFIENNAKEIGASKVLKKTKPNNPKSI